MPASMLPLQLSYLSASGQLLTPRGLAAACPEGVQVCSQASPTMFPLIPSLVLTPVLVPAVDCWSCLLASVTAPPLIYASSPAPQLADSSLF